MFLMCVHFHYSEVQVLFDDLVEMFSHKKKRHQMRHGGKVAENINRLFVKKRGGEKLLETQRELSFFN